MKNLTIKKVALGLLLAGYAASGAFAATTATTAATIKGNAPIIKSTDATPTEGKYSVQVQRLDSSSVWQNLASTEKMKVGDKIVISFDYSDADGDAAEANWITTTKTKTTADGSASLKFEVKINGTTTIIGPETGYTNVVSGTAGKYEYIIPNTAGGKKLDISLTPVSKFGDPYYGTSLTGNLFSTTNTTGPSVPPGCEDDSTTPCILPSDDDVIVRIVKGSTPVTGTIPAQTAWYGSSSTDDTIPEANIPKVGDQFTYVVVDTSSGSEVNVTSMYTKASWNFAGTNTAALGATASDSTKVVYATSYTIGINSADEIAKLYPTAPEAGAQGYNLSVTVAAE
ncbi:hypothetical protein GCM10023211_23220 [Orbus sasakiae]|uniref:Uncharacterized protein n=1 Tax=Orbus sasakiae TaxID=1078475 RepID=A0ABP9NBY0_9GAMM